MAAVAGISHEVIAVEAVVVLRATAMVAVEERLLGVRASRVYLSLRTITYYIFFQVCC